MIHEVCWLVPTHLEWSHVSSLQHPDKLVQLLRCLETLDESIKENRTMLKLFLSQDNPPAASDWTARERLLHDLPDLSWIEFPINFHVEDACITNSDWVWIVNHFCL